MDRVHAIRMRTTRLILLLAAALLSGAVSGQEVAPGGAPTLACESKESARENCPADTSAGVTLLRSTGSTPCLLGKNWGYDDSGVWVMGGCGGVFVVGGVASDVAAGSTGPAIAERETPTERVEVWGEFSPGDGFLVGRNEMGELSISAYALVRYVNQSPSEQTFTDHLGNERPVDTRQDFFPHRAMVFLKGWLGNPKLIYNIFLWTVNATDQDALFGNIGYQFNRKFSVYGGINGLPGTRSLQGSHPYWLGHDRVMADEFFRPYFTFGVWTQGEILPGLWYNVEVGNNLSSLGVKATQLDRDLSTGGSVWWMPTTHEFGPRGGFGDWEFHEKLATRFGISGTQSPEERFTDSVTGNAGNTTIRLVDSLNVFDTGALAPGVTVNNVNYQLIAIDAGMKYRGIFLQAELYKRRLDNFEATGALPVTEIVDEGFYVQGSFFPIRRKLELYAATSQIFGDSDAGFSDSSEYIIGMNFYPLDTRNHRLNVQVIDVNRSSVSSTFGYYVGGQDGTTTSVAFSVFF
jgi:Protein of unknown function (DUF3011)